MMSSSDLPDLDGPIMFMTADPRGAPPGWLFFHGRGEAWYINERDLMNHAARNTDTIVWQRPGGEIAGKINGQSARILARMCIEPKRASLVEDHGLDRPLSGGTDVMQKLQNKLLQEQGRDQRPENKHLAGLLPIEIARLARFEEGDTAGWEKWMKTQPKEVQDDWEANKEKYKDKFKIASVPSHPLAKKVSDLLEGEDLKWYDGYSGRGMFGKTSPLAFTTSISPGAALGTQLVKLGFLYDRMGKDFIYYLSHRVGKQADLLPIEVARLARFEEGDTAGWEKWMKTQPQSVQDDWAANKEKYGDKFKTASEYVLDGTGQLVWENN